MQIESHLLYSGPGQGPARVTVVGSEAAWDGLGEAITPGLRAKLAPDLDWQAKTLVLVFGPRGGAVTGSPRVARFQRRGSHVVLDVVVDPSPPDAPVPAVMNNPFVALSVEAKALAGDPTIAATWAGMAVGETKVLR